MIETIIERNNMYYCSYRNAGNLYLSKGCGRWVSREFDMAKVIFQKEHSRICVFPFQKQGWIDDPDVYFLNSMDDSALIINNCDLVNQAIEAGFAIGRYKATRLNDGWIIVDLTQQMKRYRK
ncbi:MAG: hypothetical protein GY858_09495 [Candidatus Omnitrophica bacterium]|nr:hypothetical protein [Candidatus Omnitrophota bacterium]